MTCHVGEAHTPTFPSLHLRHNSFSNPSVPLPTSQLILQFFRRFTYVTVHSPTLPLLHPRHSSFSNPSFASLTSQAFHLRHLASRPCFSRLELILQPFRHFTYVTVHSLTLPSLHLRHSSFSNPSIASTSSKLILQPFFRFSYVTSFSLTSPGEPPILCGGSADYYVYQNACYTSLPNVSATVCISTRAQSRSELSADLTGMRLEMW